MDKYRVPVGVRKHCQMVNKVAMFLAKKLRAVGVDIDVNLVNAASLLHDVFRMVNFYTFEGADREDKEVWQPLKEQYGHLGHEEIAYELLKNHYLKVAEIISRHGPKAVTQGTFKTWEDKVVLYADRRIMHTKLVTLEERYEDIELRHIDYYEQTGLDPKLERKRVQRIERNIFSNLKIKPGDLKEEIHKQNE
ncbi:MAG: HDIG domain-containing protein [Nanoarchaeota archaeon]|nr:HDIG domain-containing protein [Nanoarchaeota archaeon]